MATRTNRLVCEPRQFVWSMVGAFALTLLAFVAMGIGHRSDASASLPPGVSSLQITGVPASATAGTPLSVTVTVLNSSSQADTGFSGTVTITSSDREATLPSPITFTPADGGTSTFGVTLTNSGFWNISAKYKTLTAKAAISVKPGPTTAIVDDGSTGAQVTGTNTPLYLYGVDAYGNWTSSFRGFAKVTSTDHSAMFARSAHFSRDFAYDSVTFDKVGPQTVTVTDIADPSIQGTFNFSLAQPTLPGTPTVVALASPESATVTFSAPADLGNPPAYGYTVTSNPASYTQNIYGSGNGQVQFYGLTDGTSYTFSVVANSNYGNSAPGVSNAVTPANVPATPDMQFATPSDGSAAVTFYDPSDAADNSGYPVTSFTVNANPGNISVSLDPTDAYAGSSLGYPFATITVPGLTDGTSYTFTVTATSSFGTSLSSSASSAVTPVGPPGAPVLGSVTPSDGQASVAFTPGAQNGSTLAYYELNYTDVTSGGTGVASGGASPIVATGLTDGDSYTFNVQEVTTSNLTSPQSATSASTLVAGPPSAPDLYSATTGPEQATLRFLGSGVDEGTDGGSPVTGYTVTAEPGDLTATGTQSPIVMGGLTDGTSYTFTVTATNAVGSSPPSNSQSANTPTIPSAPAIDGATSGLYSLSVTWEQSASNGGDPIEGYTMMATPVAPFVVADPATGTVTNACCEPQTISGLTPGQAYEVSLFAYNDVGPSSSATFGPVTASGAAPGAPGISTGTPGDGQFSEPFSPPTDSGDAPVSSYTLTAVPQAPITAPSSDPVTATCTVSPDTCNGDVLTVSGLTDGQEYQFSVTATNQFGTSPPSGAQVGTPFANPSPPTDVTATSNQDGTSVVSFTPGDQGTYPVVGYAVYSNGTELNGGSSSPITVYHLTNGQPYTFTVVAITDYGTSAPSAPSNVATPGAVPSQPGIGYAVAGDGSADVYFDPSTDDGGSPITGYTVTSSPGGLTASGTTSPITVSGLTNGTSYTFTVTATNGLGTSSPSGSTTAVTPTGAPDAPTIGTATAGVGSATVSFSPPANDGGLTIESYTVTSSPGGFTGTGSASPITVTGLTSGQAYTFTVEATNTAGSSAPSGTSNQVTLPTTPDAPTSVSATPSDGSASVSFTAPADGGSPISGYTVTSSPGGLTASGTASPIDVTGLTDGTAYTFTVVATNAVGDSQPSGASTAVTPLGAPGAPTIGTATAGEMTASVSFTAPSNTGGLTITGYTVTSSPGDITATGTASPITVSGLTDGQSYTFTVTATNSTGTSPASGQSDAVVPDPVELIQNGGFENGLTGWSVSGLGATASAGNPHSGNACLLISASQFLGPTTVSQSFVDPATGSTTLTFWYKTQDIEGAPPPNYDDFSVALYDLRTGQVVTPLSTQDSVGTWTEVTSTLPTSLAGDPVSLQITNGPEFDDTLMWVDDVSVVN